jgi:hypothetical protein
MRWLLATTVLLGVILIALASSRTSAQGVSAQAGLVSGEKVRLVFELAGPSRACTVMEVRGDFLGCQADLQGTGSAAERWYNLRLIAVIDRTPKPQ